jgi:Protein of unknown function (DUF1232)
MKPEQLRTGQPNALYQPGTPKLRTLALMTWKVDGKAMTIDEYIENQRQQLMSSDIHALGLFADRLLEKLNQTDAGTYLGLGETVHLVVQLLKLPRFKQVEDPLPVWVAEVGFAAAYLLKRNDLIPDHLPEIGLVDDALILKCVIERNHSTVYRSLISASALSVGREPAAFSA